MSPDGLLRGEKTDLAAAGKGLAGKLTPRRAPVAGFWEGEGV